MKYPRTYHLPNSEGLTKDDKLIPLHDLRAMQSKEVVVTEKMDGENTTITKDSTWARSLDSTHHVSRSWLKQFASTFQHEIPESYRLCGENLYAKHSIFYDSLPSYFLLFSVWDGTRCLSWDDTEEWAKLLGIEIAPVLYRGEWNKEKIEACFSDKSLYGPEQEGYVVRIADSFEHSPGEPFKWIAKWVRKDHVQANTHWMDTEITPNLLSHEPAKSYTSNGGQ